LVMKKRIQNAWFTKDIPFWRFNISMFVWIYDIYVYYICIYIYIHMYIIYKYICIYIWYPPMYLPNCGFNRYLQYFLIYCNTMFTPVFSNCSEMP
jgi:hypothetical protein